MPEMGWASRKNGDLLRLAAEQFDAFLTVDANLSFQQHLPSFEIAVIVLVARTNKLTDLQPLAPTVLEALADLVPGTMVRIGV